MYPFRYCTVENLVNVQKAHRQKRLGEFLTSCKTWQLAILWTLCKTTRKIMNVDTTTQVADFMENNVNFHIAIHVYSIKTIIGTFAWRTHIQ